MKLSKANLLIGDKSSEAKIILLIGDYEAPKTEVEAIKRDGSSYCYFYTEGVYDGELSDTLTNLDADTTLQSINEVVSDNDNLEGILVVDCLSAFPDNNISRIRRLTTICRDKDLTLICTMHKGRITPIDTSLAVLFDAIYFI